MKAAWTLAIGLAVFTLTGCQSMSRDPLQTVDHVNLDRFMGDWYVIASIPTFIEKDAYNAVESYELKDDGRIGTTFTFRAGGFDGREKRYTPTGFVTDRHSNAVWGMQFIWPFKAEYLVTYLSEDYGVTVISRNKRDYVWIMARTPQIPAATYQALVDRVKAQGYDISQLREVPQSWPETDGG